MVTGEVKIDGWDLRKKNRAFLGIRFWNTEQRFSAGAQGHRHVLTHITGEMNGEMG